MLELENVDAGARRSGANLALPCVILGQSISLSERLMFPIYTYKMWLIMYLPHGVTVKIKYVTILNVLKTVP